MKNTSQLLLLILLISCVPIEKIGVKENDIQKIEVFSGYPGEQTQMINGFENNLIEDLNNSIYIGPTKFRKTHKILIYHSDGAIDTIFTNGNIHQFNGWYRSEENLIEKYRR